MPSTLHAFALAAALMLSLSKPALAQDAAPLGACLPPEAVPAAVRGAPFLVFAEVHGTREVPEFIGAYLCAAARERRKITLAIEFSSSEQGAIDRFMASLGTVQDVERFTSGPRWHSPMQDGRTSAAMLAMFDAIRALRASGADIRVVAIDADVPTARRDAAMAAHLRSELGRSVGRQLVVLTGGPHAIRTKGKRFDPHYESAIYLLADQRPLALTVGTAGGSAWVCQGTTPAACGATAWDVNRVSPAPAGVFNLTPPSGQFDGVFYIGATTASPPAVGARPPPHRR